MSKLLDYLNHLDQNASAREAHIQHPNKAMSDFGLAPHEQAAMHSGDKEQVALVIGIRIEELPAIEFPQF